MAFEANQNEIRRALSLDKEKQPDQVISQGQNYETKKQYQFTLYPSNREKLRLISKERGYRSDSAFLDDLINNL